MAEITFPLPDLGEGLEDAVVLEWHVKVGDRVERNDVIVELETTKSAVEIPSPQSGVVVALGGGEGDTIVVGAPLITFDIPDDVAGIVGTVPEDRSPEKRVRLSAPLDD